MLPSKAMPMWNDYSGSESRGKRHCNHIVDFSQMDHKKTKDSMRPLGDPVAQTLRRTALGFDVSSGRERFVQLWMPRVV
jgi:hypothetical protein